MFLFSYNFPCKSLFTLKFIKKEKIHGAFQLPRIEMSKNTKIEFTKWSLYIYDISILTHNYKMCSMRNDLKLIEVIFH